MGCWGITPGTGDGEVEPPEDQGAYLLDSLGLVPRQHARAKPAQYRFDDVGKARLSAWTRENLLLLWEVIVMMNSVIEYDHA